MVALGKDYGLGFVGIGDEITVTTEISVSKKKGCEIEATIKKDVKEANLYKSVVSSFMKHF